MNIKWRPLDDFLIVACSDGTVYVWQMETGHLDRVLHGRLNHHLFLNESELSIYFIGMIAEEVINACYEIAEADASASTSDLGLANPAVHFFRGLRHRNMNAIKHATQRGIHQLQQLQNHHNTDGILMMKNRSSPLVIQGLRTNPKGTFI